MTGAARRLGRAMALDLARAGADVVVHYGGSAEAAEATAAEARGFGVRAEAISADLAEPAAIAALADRVGARFGRLDVLVNNAATFDRQPFEEISVEDWERSMRTNLRAPFLTTQRLLPLLRASAAGRAEGEAALVLNVGDLSGVHPWRDFVQHGVSKAGVLHLTRILARELAPDVRVNALIPGVILPAPGVDEASQEWAEAKDRVPMRRDGGPMAVVEALRYLLAADFANGVLLPVDGGEGLLGPVGH